MEVCRCWKRLSPVGMRVASGMSSSKLSFEQQRSQERTDNTKHRPLRAQAAPPTLPLRTLRAQKKPKLWPPASLLPALSEPTCRQEAIPPTPKTPPGRSAGRVLLPLAGAGAVEQQQSAVQRGAGLVLCLCRDDKCLWHEPGVTDKH